MAFDFSRMEVLQSAQTTGNGTAHDLTFVSDEWAIYVEWSAGVSAGAVAIETALTKDYSGTWAPLGGVTATGASRVDVFAYSGATAAVRARISTTVTGGTVTCTLVTNPRR